MHYDPREHFDRRLCPGLLRARQPAFAAGHPVAFVDADGRCIEAWPNGKRFEIRLDSSKPRESHRVIPRELTSTAP